LWSKDDALEFEFLGSEVVDGVMEKVEEVGEVLKSEGAMVKGGTEQVKSCWCFLSTALVIDCQESNLVRPPARATHCKKDVAVRTVTLFLSAPFNVQVLHLNSKIEYVDVT
jgi:hypothetical protein